MLQLKSPGFKFQGFVFSFGFSVVGLRSCIRRATNTKYTRQYLNFHSFCSAIWDLNENRFVFHLLGPVLWMNENIAHFCPLCVVVCVCVRVCVCMGRIYYNRSEQICDIDASASNTSPIPCITFISTTHTWFNDISSQTLQLY